MPHEIDPEDDHFSDDPAPMFPMFEEFAPEDSKMGFLESATMQTIRDRTEKSWLGPGDAGPVALALITARKVDRMSPRDAASGQANLLRAMKEIFEMLPQPEAVGSSDLGEVLDAIRDEEQGELDG